MTQKLYYLDSEQMRFQASVLSCEETKGGYAVVLDATAFYPEGGGQASDTGVLGNARVLSSKEEGETVVHLCSEPLAVGSTVEGIVDAQPRRIRSQQHSGEHIVSGIVHRRFGYHNVGFHMNLHEMVIDFDGVITAQQLAEIELEANQAVWSNIPLHIWTPAPEELKTVSYRTKRELPWPVRIVEIPGYDTCACCGTHVKATGQIGLIKLFSCTPCRGGTRIEMACGKAALDRMNCLIEQNKLVSQALSVPQEETAKGTQAILSQLETVKFRAVQLRREQSARVEEGYQNAGNVVHFTEGLNGNELRELADGIAAVCGGRAAVFSGEADRWNYCLADRQNPVQSICKGLNAAFSGRGGGKPNFCQGSVKGEKETIRQFLKEN